MSPGRVAPQRTGKSDVRFSCVIEMRCMVRYSCVMVSQAYFRKLRSPRNAFLRNAF
jgi:hypothetical protein